MKEMVTLKTYYNRNLKQPNAITNIVVYDSTNYRVM